MKTFMKVVGVLTIIGGIICGIVFGRIEIVGYFSTYTEFSFGIAIIWWLGGIFSGCLIYSVGIILDRLDEIKMLLTSKVTDNPEFLSVISVVYSFIDPHVRPGASDFSNALPSCWCQGLLINTSTIDNPVTYKFVDIEVSLLKDDKVVYTERKKNVIDAEDVFVAAA